MEPKSLSFLRFMVEEEGHEELLKLSLSNTPTSSSSPVVMQQNPQFNPYCNLPSINPHHQDSFPNSPNSRKRLFSQSTQTSDGEKDDQELFDLSLSIAPPGSSSSRLPSTSHSPSPSPSPSSNPNPNPVRQVVTTGSVHYQPRVRRNPFQTPKRGKSETIAAPYPWATTRRATVHNLNYLLSQNIRMISGDIECKGCQETYRIEYNLEEKFEEIKDFVSANRLTMNDRAPESWMNPRLDSCETCGNSLKPVIPKKRDINWLFLLLGQMLGCCKLSELKYFCKHTKNHRTGAKNRVLYLAYLELCKQLYPDGPFDV